MKVVSVVNTKGGTGKSTIATNLAASLSKAGYKTLLVDTDAEQNSALNFAQVRVDERLSCLPAAAIPGKNLYRDIGRYDGFDLVVIDAGAGDTAALRGAILSGRRYGMLLIPVLQGQFDLWGAEDTLRLLEESREALPAEDLCCLVMNRVHPNRRLKMAAEARRVVTELAGEHAVTLLASVVGDRVAYKQAVPYGMGVEEYAAFVEPRSEGAAKAAAEIKQLAAEVEALLLEGGARDAG